MNTLCVWTLAGLLLVSGVSGNAQTPVFDPEEQAEIHKFVDEVFASLGGATPATSACSPEYGVPPAAKFTRQQRCEIETIFLARLRAGLAQSSAPAPIPVAPGTKPVVTSPPVVDMTRPENRAGSSSTATAHRAPAPEQPSATQLAGVAASITETGTHDATGIQRASGFQLAAGTNETRASLRYDFSKSLANQDGTGHFTTRSLAFSAPIDESNKQGSNLISLDGLSSKFDVTFNYAKVRAGALGIAPSDGDTPWIRRLPDACRTLGLGDECEYSDLISAARDSKTTEGQRILREFLPRERTWLYGYRIRAGYDDFVFYDPSTLAKRSMREVPWGVGGYWGTLKGTSYYSLGLDFVRSYKAGEGIIACPNDEASSPVVCTSGPLSPPTSKQKYLLSVEGRWLIAGVGTSAKVTRDVRNDEWGIDVPVYLFPNSDGLLSGGLRFGWNDESRFTVGIFVGVPFKPLP